MPIRTMAEMSHILGLRDNPYMPIRDFFGIDNRHEGHSIFAAQKSSINRYNELRNTVPKALNLHVRLTRSKKSYIKDIANQSI